VLLTTAGSAFNTLLAVYTGNSVSNLSEIASDNNSGGTSNRSIVHFTAATGMTYDIAVDGVNGASSRINLSLTLGSGLAPQLRTPARLPDGRAQFVVSGDANHTYAIEASADLVTWGPAGSVTTGAAGTGAFIDAASTNLNRRFYRAHD
jgi:hypothetical protein